MAEYIDKELLIRVLKNREDCVDCTDTDCVDCMCDFIACIVPSDVADVRHGKWVKTYPDEPLDGHYYCSRCNKGIDIATGKETPIDRDLFYCANCGAKMGDDEE